MAGSASGHWQAAINCNLGAGELKLVTLETREKISELFSLEFLAVTENEIDILPNLGRDTLFTIYEEGRIIRYFHGIISEIHHIDENSDGFHYKILCRPWLDLLRFNRAYRIFEQKSALDIIKDVLRPFGRQVDYSRLTNAYGIRPYCTQYRESDLDFVSRLMEQEGIYYHFRHTADAHILTLCDGRSSHDPAPGYADLLFPRSMHGAIGSPETIWDWHETATLSAERDILLQSHDYEAPRVLSASASGAQQTQADNSEVHAFTGNFTDPALGQHWARMQLEAARASRRVFTGRGDGLGLACGGTLKLRDATGRRGVNAEFLLTGVRHSIPVDPIEPDHVHPVRYVELEAVRSDTPYRAPRRFDTPVASGPETAIVVQGGADDANGDPMGRVRVEFHWGGRSKSNQPARSCWLRISHPSAGSEFGHFALPRYGEEVIVTFLDGDPDRPIITGRVYNGDHRHPYPLPNERMRSVWRSRTIGNSGSYVGAEKPPTGKGYNELSFNDRGGAEEVYLRAQRDRRTEVMLDDALTIQRDRKQRVGRDRETAIAGDDRLTVESGDLRVRAEKGSVVLEATKSLVLKVGQNCIVMDQAGITISGLTITSLGLTSNMMLGTRAEVQGVALAKVTGALALLMPSPAAGAQAAVAITRGMASAALAAAPKPGAKP